MVLWNFGTYYGKNYGTMETTMVLWKKIKFYTKNYGTSIYEDKKTW